MRSLHYTGLALLALGIGACQQTGDEAASMDSEDESVAGEAATAVRQSYPDLPADVVFESDRVVAQKVSADAGTWSGEHSHPGGQIVVVLEGGTVTYREGGDEITRTFEAGDVAAVDAIDSHDHASDAPMSFVLLSIAPGEGGAGAAQDYPNSPAEVVLENDHVIAQRLVAEHGTWAGEHGHAGGQLVVVIKGGTMTYREGGEEIERTFSAGEVFEVEPIENHDHMVTSDSVESIILTLK